MASAREVKALQDTTPLLGGQTNYGTQRELIINVPDISPAEPVVAKPGWGRWLVSGAYNNALKPIGNRIYDAVTHPLTTLKTTAKALPALITAAPAAINAFLSATHTKSEDISGSWWASMLPDKKFHSILNASASLYSNFIMNGSFLSSTWTGLKETFKSCCKGAKNFFGNIGLMALSLIAAITAAAIAYNAFLLFGGLAAGIPAAINFTLYFATGFVSIKSLVKKIQEARSPDAKFQRECVEKLKHIKADYIAEINEFLTQQHVNEALQELQKPGLDKLRELELQGQLQVSLRDLLQVKLTALAEMGVIIKERSSAESAKAWAGTLFDMVVASSVLLPCFVTFTEAGFRGIEIIAKLSGSAAVGEIPQLGKIGIGTLPGLMSSLYYAMTTANCRHTLVGLTKRLYHHPREIPGALLFLTLAGLSATGMENIAFSIANSKNIFSVAPVGTLSQLYVIFNTLSAATMNATLMANEKYLNKLDIRPSSPFESLVHYLERTDTHPLPHDMVEQLKGLGLFQAKSTSAAGYERVAEPAIERGSVSSIV
ncbi:MAG: hypothetical protein A3E84_01300 [Gammaproteobacteria bacterium RIFCSPHIGHO2_12_FULL_42_13]|nr:MAG: hypothetical protein A3E84_01300 [Gammaproteobacteria bacterium RIFCSPHIGHO2_12_FULL_42_13]